MSVYSRVKAVVQSIGKTNNSMGEGLADPNGFLKYGGKRALVQDWSKVMMLDRDMYTGYSYAAINNRGNMVASLAKYNVKTNASKPMIEAAKKKQEEVKHPYIDIIDKSKTFANNKFWYDISTYLDLEGVYYLMVVRTVAENRIGNPQEFRLLNPYDIRRIINKETFEVGGYVEARDGMVREFSPKMIIEIRKLNPFDADEAYSMTDAAKESQFTMKQAGDYTRHSLKNNMAAPGIISTDVLLDPQQFANFVSRVTNQEKGLPLFGNGAGAITWDSMQIDLDKAGLKDINEMNRQALFAVSGIGKTMMSIEESGTTRDTAKVQKDLVIENHIIPQLDLILDALNQDYKVNYETEYAKNSYQLYVDNPLGTDREAELKDINIRDKSYALYIKLVDEGYDRDLAARFAQGLIGLDELGKPTNEPKPDPAAAVIPPVKETKVEPPAPKPAPKKDTKKKEAHIHEVTPIVVVKNELDDQESGIITDQQGALQNAVMQIEARVVNSVINKVTKNDFETQDSVINGRDKRDYEKDLELALAAFYTVIIPIYATSTMNRRLKEFGKGAVFKMDRKIKEYINDVAEKASLSHINTIVEDLRKATKEGFDNAFNNELSKIITDGRSPTDADLALARKKALEGASQQEIVNAIKQEYSGNIAPNRAKAIARTETNRAFTQSQYQADLQFIEQNDLEGKAYKKWITTSSAPCPICTELASMAPIPFKVNFADIGDEIVVTYKDENGKTKVQKQLVNFEALNAGNAHVNCGCKYMLIIE